MSGVSGFARVHCMIRMNWRALRQALWFARRPRGRRQMPFVSGVTISRFCCGARDRLKHVARRMVLRQCRMRGQRGDRDTIE
jgi:hypothetical protein